MTALRILYMDADTAELQRFERNLGAGGHSLLRARDVEEASEILLNDSFDAVILGSGLPGPDVAEWVDTLRAIEQREGRSRKAPIVRLTTVAGMQPLPCRELSDPITDFVCCGDADPSALIAIVERMAAEENSALARPAGHTEPELTVFDAEEFRAQVGFDSELLVEIVDLFLAEREQQLPNMRAALEAGDYDLLCRQAHTIKGSLGSLHAAVARFRAQDLEAAAKDRNDSLCRRLFALFERDLEALEPHLTALRNSTGGF